MKTRPFLSRRGFLKVTSLASGAFLLERTLFGGGEAQAATGTPNFLLLVYFSGGWDQLLAFDPRDATQAAYQWSGSGNMTPPSSGIHPAYDVMAAGDTALNSVLTATAGKGVQKPSGTNNVSFGPAVPQSLLDHGRDLCLVRGMSMDTLTHDVGRRYLLTGKFPRGLQASGSSLNTVWAGQVQGASDLDVPNLAIDVESYNESYPSFASATNVGSQTDLLNVLQNQTPTLTAGTDGALQRWEATEDSCGAHGFDASGLVGAFRSSRTRARQMTGSTKATLFRFNTGTGAPFDALFSALGVTNPATFNFDSPIGNAAIAGMALTQGISQAVSVTLGSDLDDHFDEAGSQSVKLRTGFDALGRLIAYLKGQTVPGTTKSFWDCTTLLTFSEFSRTPMMNARDGRDHHLTGSCLVAGPGIKGDTVIGASSDVGMGIQKVNGTTGLVDANGMLLRPPDVHATVLKSMGLSSSHLSNQSPQFINAMLKTP